MFGIGLGSQTGPGNRPTKCDTMKRKKAMAFNAPGGTRQYIGAGAQNMIDNGYYMNPVTCNLGVDVIGGTDYSYTQWAGSPSRIFRKKFNLSDWGFIDRFDLYDDLIPLGRLDTGVGRVPRYVYWYLGWRIVVEYFDTNAIVDFTNRIDDDMEKAEAMECFVKRFSTHYSVSVLTENIINITDKN